MTTDELGHKVDPNRLEPREGGTKGQSRSLLLVPQGATFTQEESVTVDESAVQGQSRSAKLAGKKKATRAPANPAPHSKTSRKGQSEHRSAFLSDGKATGEREG